jgi:phenylacetate-CoA ligase
LADVPEHVWLQRGQANALATFRRAARTVPAYRAFLKEHGIRPRDIRTFDDFQQLPATSKENYLLKHDLAELMPGGRLDGTCVITRSSGYTGQPIFRPRLKRQDDGAVRGIGALYSLYDVAHKSTLALNTFSLGTHVAGQTVTDLSLRFGRMPGNRLAFATPGASVEDTIELASHLSPRFEQTIIWGYPSLILAIVKRGAESGIRWSDLNTSVIYGGEGCSEGWRRLMVDLLGGEPHPMRVASAYGSAEGGLMGFDTPISVLAKKAAHDDKKLHDCLFNGQPPLAFIQFSPVARFFETIDGELALTCWQAIPMVRYSLRDAGDVIPFSVVMDRFKSCGLEPGNLLQANHADPQSIWRWPFLSCFGRSDGTVSIVGANVYPHTLQHVFASRSEVSHFKLAVEDDAAGQSRLTVYVEWADGVPSPEAARRLERTLHEQVVGALLQGNWDYRGAMREDPAAADPRILILPKGSGPFAADSGRWKRAHVHKANG